MEMALWLANYSEPDLAEMNDAEVLAAYERFCQALDRNPRLKKLYEDVLNHD
jgi:hypothetical protein